MKSFALLCFLLLASACVFARAEEETAVEEPKTEDQPEVAADEENQEAEEPEAESDEETEENDEEDEETDDENEKRSGCKPICHLVCRKKWCTRRVCKRVQCGYRKICRYITRYRIVKYKVKLPYSYDYYGPKYAIKIKKIPYNVAKCHLVPKYCTRCHTVRYICGKICHKVCKQRKCYQSYQPYQPYRPRY